MPSEPVDISVVIPVYRSRDCVAELLKQLTAELSALASSHEIILVDDDSPDDSWEMIRAQLPAYPYLTAIQLMANAGQIRATLYGLQVARGDIVVTMDDDLQHRPDQLRPLVQRLRDDPALDCVFGCFPEKRHAWYRNVGSRMVTAAHAHAFGLPRDIRPSSFRVMRRPLVQAILRHRTHSPSLTAMICASTRRMVSVPIEHAERHAGTSNYTLTRQLRLAFDNLCSSSTLPLKAVSVLGLSICAGSFLYMLYTLWRYATHRIGVPGWTTLTVLQSFFAGVTLLSLGVFGEYMIRILREVRGNPTCVERSRVSGGDSPSNAPGDGAAATGREP